MIRVLFQGCSGSAVSGSVKRKTANSATSGGKRKAASAAASSIGGSIHGIQLSSNSGDYLMSLFSLPIRNTFLLESSFNKKILDFQRVSRCILMVKHLLRIFILLRMQVVLEVLVLVTQMRFLVLKTSSAVQLNPQLGKMFLKTSKMSKWIIITGGNICVVQSSQTVCNEREEFIMVKS